MRIATSSTDALDSREAARSAFAALREKISEPVHYIVVQATADYDCALLGEEFSRLSPGTPVHGGTTCQGVMTEAGFRSAAPGRGLGLFAISDAQGAYGTGDAEIGDDPQAAGISAARKALAAARRPGEAPAIIWMTSAPGVEEEVIAGLVKYFGPNVPVCGGSSADNEVAGKWSQFSQNVCHSRGVIISVLFPSRPIGFAFQGGYQPAGPSALVTSGSGHSIHQLDGRPAAEVYNGWIDGKLSDRLGGTSTVLMETSLYPLGRIVGEFGGIPYYQLSHPAKFTSELDLSLFTQVKEGERIYLMQGTKDALVTRPTRVVESALRNSPSPKSRIAGALVIYCAGCMLTVRERMPEVVDQFKGALGEETPFLGAFTFGEQGCFFGGENRHGNLMISVLLFLE